MILKTFIIGPGGILCCSKEFFGPMEKDEEIISGFLTGISDFASEIKGGKIEALYFHNFNIVYSYSVEYGVKFVIIIEKDDFEEEAKSQVELMKNEFINRYGPILKKWNDEISVFKEFEDFIEENIYIPPKILLIGENGVGKTTILDLMPGETILELDDDLNEILYKKIEISNGNSINKCMIYELDIKTLISNITKFINLLKAADIVLLVTNSAASNLGRFDGYISRLKLKTSKTEYYIIANFQDTKEIAFEPIKIEESFNIKTFGLTATNKDSQHRIMEILREVLRNLVEIKKNYLK